MAQLETARQRLERAIEQLEHALAERLGRPDSDDPHLQEALERVRQDYETLRGTTQTVRRRLDQAIDRLETLLEH